MAGERDTSAAAAPDVLICAGLDPSGGAGFLADAAIVRALGGRPVGVVTSLTVQNTEGMREAHPVDAEVLGDQLRALLTDVEVRAVKLGMLGSREIVRALGEQLGLTRAPVVWDPVGAPTRGTGYAGRELLEGALVDLADHLALITPNTRELGFFAGREIAALDEARRAGKELAARANTPVLVTGGHLDGDEVIDLLCDRGSVTELRGPRLPRADVHGTGCALSSAIATFLGLGHPLDEACALAKPHVAERIANPVRPGRGAPAIV